MRVAGEREGKKAPSTDATTELLNQPAQSSFASELLIMENESSSLKLFESEGGVAGN